MAVVLRRDESSERVVDRSSPTRRFVFMSEKILRQKRPNRSADEPVPIHSLLLPARQVANCKRNDVPMLLTAVEQKARELVVPIERWAVVRAGEESATPT